MSSKHRRWSALSPICLVVGATCAIHGSALARGWTWISGSPTVNAAGTYGTQGQASPLNTPGARVGAVGWTDSQGRFWLFGGEAPGSAGGLSFLNDLWRFDPQTKQWTWMGGSQLPAQPGVYGSIGFISLQSWPGARRDATAWTDTSGNFWLFGGTGLGGAFSPGQLNDMWKYDPHSNQWTYVKGTPLVNIIGAYGELLVSGPANNPGGRSGAVSWASAPLEPTEEFRLFGGNGFARDFTPRNLGDLWRYQTATGRWTWIKGGSDGGERPVYPGSGVDPQAVTPGALNGAVAWRDGAGRSFLFGGFGWRNDSEQGYLNDFWEYHATTNTWVLRADSRQLNQGESPRPSQRSDSMVWVDPDNNLWLFGGKGVDGFFTLRSALTDLWRFDTRNHIWEYQGEGGRLEGEISGVYGTRDLLNPENFPGSRVRGTTWTDTAGNLWLFGGEGYDRDGNVGRLNDMWRFTTTNSLDFEDAYEPNNFPDLGALRPALASGTTSNLRARDEDWYLIPDLGCSSVRIIVESVFGQGDLNAELYDYECLDSVGYPLRIGASYSTTGQEVIHLVDRNGASGRKLLRVYREGVPYTGQTYSIRIDDFGQDDIYEPNNEPCTAVDMQLGQTYSNLIFREDDFYRFQTAGLTSLRIKLEANRRSGFVYFMVLEDDPSCGWNVIAGDFARESDVIDIPGINIGGRSSVLVRVYGSPGSANFYNLTVVNDSPPPPPEPTRDRIESEPITSDSEENPQATPTPLPSPTPTPAPLR